jgi:hypothetical protein
MNDQLYALPPLTLRLVKNDLRRRAAVVDYLRGLAREIEEGEVAAEAALVVVSFGDVHEVFIGPGYYAWPVLSAAASSTMDAFWAALNGREYDATKKALERQATRQYHAKELAAALAAKPFVCACGDRFKTERGRDMHVKRPGGRRWFSNNTKHHAAVDAEEPVRLRVVERGKE